MNPLIWLRSEIKENEKRVALSPTSCAELVQAGASVVVESCSQRIFKDEEYKRVGCEVVHEQDWKQAPENATIIGLKELEDEDIALHHKHIYFAHCYKEQSHAKQILSRFKRGRGKLYDLEFLTNENNQRIAAFGKWAGFVGAGLGVDTWVEQMISPYEGSYTVRSYSSKEEFVNHLTQRLSSIKKTPKVLVIGAHGRSGGGATELLEQLNFEVTHWGKEQTDNRWVYPEIFDHDILINCVYLTQKFSPFVTKDQLRKGQRLTVISDVSCDPNSPNNPLPVYSKSTTMNKPITRVSHSPLLDVTAIDNLPSILPKESSEDFSDQLLPYLKEFIFKNNSLPFIKSLDVFKSHMNLGNI